MYSRYTLETRLPMTQVLERLARVIRPRRSRWEALEAGLSWEQESEPPFVGRIDGDRFIIRRIIRYRNSFLPLISGHVAPVASGSRIDIVLRLRAPVAVVMVVWLTMAFAAAAAGLWHTIRTSDARGLIAVVFPLFGCGLVAVGFIPEKRRAIKILTDALTEETEALSRRLSETGERD
jgi:hypothetical protein